MTVSVKCKVPQLESVVDKGSTTMYGLKKNSDQIKPQGKILNMKLRIVHTIIRIFNTYEGTLKTGKTVKFFAFQVCEIYLGHSWQTCLSLQFQEHHLEIRQK